MKKIGILTFHRAHNYGAYMQCFSLYRKLSKSFPDVEIEIIDYDTLTRNLLKNIRRFSHLKKLDFKSWKIRMRQHINFVKSYKNLNLSEKIITNHPQRALSKIDGKYDVIVVGSDAVFNWSDIGLPNLYFLSGLKKSKKVTYAASSHLQKYKDVSREQFDYIKKSLEEFNYLGVRDLNTEKFISYFNNHLKSSHNCDPTVFLEFDYETPNLEKKLKKNNIDLEKPIIFIMLKSRKYAEYVRKFYSNYQIIALTVDNDYANCFLYDLTPLEWSKVFSYGKLTVTDFFHGTLLSLKNGTPVVSIDTSKYTDENYESKVKDLLCRRLNLSDFYIDSRGFSSEEFHSRCEKLLNNEYSTFIKKELEKEAESYMSFEEELTKLLKGL